MGLGGATDSSYLNGHDYTYEGAKCGRIIEMLNGIKMHGSIIFFDELDKISDTSKGKRNIKFTVSLNRSFSKR